MPVEHVISPELYYTKTHEWISVDENLVTVGLTSHRLNQLGEILYLDLPEDGKNVHQGEVFFSLESVKDSHDVVAPVSGTIIEVNLMLPDDPGVMNDDPFDDGWLVKIEMDNEKDLASLMKSIEYRVYIGQKVPVVVAPPVDIDPIGIDEGDLDEDFELSDEAE